MFEAKATVIYTAEHVADLLCAALEGGSRYWCRELEVLDAGTREELDLGAFEFGVKCKEFWETNPDVIFRGFDDEGDKWDEARVNLENINKALDQLHKERPGFNIENHDAWDGDAFFQILFFGKTIYG